MTRRRRVLLLLAAALALALTLIAVLVRQRVQRQRVLRPASTETAASPARVPPVEQWTDAFERLEGDELNALLTQIEQQHPDLYAKWSLGYLHAVASGDAQRFAPFLAKDNPFRELALYHRAALAEGEEASRLRMALIDEYPRSMYRDEVIEDELAYLASNPQRLIALAEKLAPAAPTALRRDMGARVVEALAPRDPNAALTRGLALLRGGTVDDASDRVARALDRAEILKLLSNDQRVLLGETFQNHRHYDRAIALLGTALRSAYSDDLQFALGRSYYGAEKYAEAQAAYQRGAKATKNPGQQATFLWHAARAAQLRGDDKSAEQLMTQTIAVKGTHPATTPAITQRLRTRIKQKRFKEAAADLALLRKLAPKERAVLEASLAYAVGNPGATLVTLNAIPPALTNDSDDAEIAYWRGRALEKRDPSAAVREYLAAVKSDTAFATFARTRLASMNLDRERALRDAQVRALVAAKKFDLAKRMQTDRVHLSTTDRDAQLQKLAQIYRELPAYRDVLDLKPLPMPRFPVKETDRATLLMAMGLQGEAEDEIEKRWALRPAREALTRSLALNRGGASRASIFAVEVLMKSVPRDFQYELLPPVVRQLLYPRYFYGYILADAKSFETDPALVLAIMREESRFNPRAKSQAAARGLLQFIITTARDIGRDVGLVDVSPEDLYDPRVIIRLGAKYISELAERFEGNRYRATAAYNAGPNQVALWTRLQPAPGDDYFVTAISFDETKGYVRKVMASWERYSAR